MAKNSKISPAVVVNGGDSNGYGVVSNLGMLGVPVFSVDSNPENITFYSKYAKKVLCPNYETSESDFISFLVNFGKRLSPKPILFVTGDLQLLTVLKYRSLLEDYYHMPMPSLSVAKILVDKVTFYDLLKKHNFSHAPTYVPKNMNEAAQLSKHLVYPYIIKPVQSKIFSKKFGNKCLEVNSKEEFLHFFRLVAEVEDTVIVQKRIEGAERYLVYTYFNANSDPLAVSCYKKERIFPIDYGNACMCRINWNEDAIDLCLNVLKKIKYHGLAEAEIQRDKNDGKYKLVEINARSTTEARLSSAYGINMEYLAYNDMIGSKISLDNKKINNDLIWIDLLRDFLSVFSSNGYLRNNKITFLEWLNSYKGKRAFAYLNFKDPLPFTMEFIKLFKTYILKKK